MTEPTAPPPDKVGIFRRIAVQRYSMPLRSELPAMLTPQRPRLLACGILLAVAGGLGLLWLGR